MPEQHVNSCQLYTPLWLFAINSIKLHDLFLPLPSFIVRISISKQLVSCMNSLVTCINYVENAAQSVSQSSDPTINYELMVRVICFTITCTVAYNRRESGNNDDRNDFLPQSRFRYVEMLLLCDRQLACQIHHKTNHTYIWTYRKLWNWMFK